MVRWPESPFVPGKSKAAAVYSVLEACVNIWASSETGLVVQNANTRARKMRKG